MSAWRLVTLLLISSARLAAQTLSVPVTVDTLPNGLVLIVHEDHSTPIVAVNLWHHVGSGDEKAGRTGLAHLFEHLMFMGSQHAEYPAFDRLLEAAGGDNNASTSEDQTNYYESGPANALPLMLWLEADRMGWFLPTMTAEKVNAQRDVVKNERRQSYENQPYGLSEETILAMLYPAGHPYSWPVVGSMTDLSAASLEDVKTFFSTYYAPNNASIVVAGDVNTADVLKLVRQDFAEVPRGPAITRPTAPAVVLTHDTMAVLEDHVELARVYYTWPTVRENEADDIPLRLLAYILAGDKNSRLTQALVYHSQLASEVYSYEDGKRVAGEFHLVATAKPDGPLAPLQPIIQREVARLAAEGPTARELTQAQNAIEARLLRRLERVDAKADALNRYYSRTGHPDGFAAELARYRAVTAADIKRVAARYITGPRVVLSIVPTGKTALAAPARGATP
ncbi:MAG: pitrilysin family protein [Gemmatimonadota bacterium]